MWPSTINHVLPCFNVVPSAGTRQKSPLPIGCVSSTEVQLGSSTDVQYILWQPLQSSAYFLQQQLLSQEQQQQWTQLLQLQQQQKEVLPSLHLTPRLPPGPQPVEQLEQPRQPMLQLQVRLQAQSQEPHHSMLLCQNNELEQRQLLERQGMQFGHLRERHKLERRQQYQQCPKLIPVQRQQAIQMEQCFNLQLFHLIERHRLEWHLLSELGSEQPCHLYLLLLEQQRDQIIKLDKENFLKHQELHLTHVKQRGCSV